MNECKTSRQHDHATKALMDFRAASEGGEDDGINALKGRHILMGINGNVPLMVIF